MIFFMNPLAEQYYQSTGLDFFSLNDQKDLNWEEFSEKIPELPRSWFELAQISPPARCDFVQDLWMQHLSYHPTASKRLMQFFSSLGSIEIILMKRDFLSAEMVYSLADNSSFFRGLPPTTERDIQIFSKEICPNLPKDYLSFFLLHNGFGKLSEIEILPMEEVPRAIESVCQILKHQSNRFGNLIDPATLIPFFEERGMNSFQCFLHDWYPRSEMGNVFLSGMDYTVSEERGFACFIEWLSSYLEGMEIS